MKPLPAFSNTQNLSFLLFFCHSGPGPTSKVNKASAQHMPPHRYPLDNSRYLRTAVIKQAANKQSVILENQ